VGGAAQRLLWGLKLFKGDVGALKIKKDCQGL